MITKIDSLLQSGDLFEASRLIKRSIREKIDLKGKQIRYAHALMLASDWNEIISLMPINTNFFATSEWLNSVAKNQPVNGNDEPIPWFTYPAIDFLDSIVESTWKVFEWGSGNSTLWWSTRVDEVVAVEDNRPWFERIKEQIPDNVDIHFEDDKKSYAEAIIELGQSMFDVVVIDGSYRNKCAENAVKKIKNTGIIIFDNSDGADHAQGQLFLLKSGFYHIDFWGLTPSYLYKNCTSVYFKSFEIFQKKTLPFQHNSSVGVSCYQAMDRS